MAQLHSPLTQFEIHPILPLYWGGVDVSFTNASLFMSVGVGLAITLILLTTRTAPESPEKISRIRALGEIIINFVLDTIEQAGGLKAHRYAPVILTLFLFILFCNLLGMIPYGYTVTSQIAVTFAMALGVFIFSLVLGIKHQGLDFLRRFFPHGTPLFLAPLVIPIEVLSYLSRPISLSVRLFANMVAGHAMLKIFAGFVALMGVLGFIPLAATIGLTLFEIAIAGLQAYVFTVLTCVYIGDALEHH